MGKAIDLTGQKFGRLTVVSKAETKNNAAVWNCVCDCGKSVFVFGYNLRKGHTRSCGCLREEKLGNKCKNIKGKRFGRLVANCRAENNGKVTMWKCQCDCGNEAVVATYRLINGETKSCGCLRNELLKNGNRKHGLSKHRLSHVWAGMKQRCFNPKAHEYSAYGGRGITVCEEWKNSYKAFYDYVSKLPHFNEEGYSLDRINNNGNYEPGNVRWATREQQYENRGY